MTLPLPALVLTAGRGTRLLPLTLTRAKPAVPVAGVPLISRILRWLSAQRVANAVLNLHHHPASLTAIVGDGAAFGLHVRYSWEHPQVLGSAGGPRRALPLLACERFLIINGDTLTDVELSELAAFHERTGAQVTLAVIPNPAPQRYGGVLVNDSGCVTGFTKRGDARQSWHFIGLQVAQARLFADLPDGVPAESVAGVYRQLMTREPGSVRAWRTEGHFLDVGTPLDYLHACIDYAAREGHPMPSCGTRVSISASARVVDSVLWDDVRLGDRVRLERCVVADGAVVPDGCTFRDCALAPASALTAGLGVGRVEHGLIVAPLDPYAQVTSAPSSAHNVPAARAHRQP